MKTVFTQNYNVFMIQSLHKVQVVKTDRAKWKSILISQINQ